MTFTGPFRHVIRDACHDASFALTGGPFGQAINQLRRGFLYEDCAFLDAPEYIPLGGVQGTNFGKFAALCTTGRREQ